MKVVFLEDVPNVAKAGAIKEVADGYGRNFLLPKKLAVVASPGALSRLEAQHRTRKAFVTQDPALHIFVVTLR